MLVQDNAMWRSGAAANRQLQLPAGRQKDEGGHPPKMLDIQRLTRFYMLLSSNNQSQTSPPLIFRGVCRPAHLLTNQD